MNCDEIHSLFHAYIDGELDLVHSLEVEGHVKSCAACAAAKRSLLSLRSALRQGDLAYRAPESLRRQVRRIARGANEEEPSRREGNYLWRWLAIGATGFAVITLLLRPAGMSERDRFLNDAVGSHVRSLMVEHLTDVASSDRHTVKPWFDGKLDFAPDVKDFAAQDFPLVGGRLDYLNGRAVAALVYRRNKHLINVFVWPSRNAGDGGTGTLRGYSVINRDARELHYCLVSDLNEKELRDLADLLVQ
jgi:anti-sigma factor RsiW